MILKHRDKDLLRFEWLEPQGVRIVSVNESKLRFLPLYSKWLAFPVGVGQGMMERLKTLKGFRFKRHRYYNLSFRRLRQIEDFLQKRILQIEQFSEKADDVFGATQKVGTVKSVDSESLALQIVANIKVDPFASYEELSDILGIPRRTLARRMKELVSAGLIRRSGAAKNGHWDIVERAVE